MNGSIAIGSRRTPPTAPVAAAVVSEDSVEPMKMPLAQSRASVTSGMVVLRRPPKRMALISTPSGALYSGGGISIWVIGVESADAGGEHVDLADRRAEPRVRVRGGTAGLGGPLVALPVGQVRRGLLGHAFPPD